MQSPYPPGSIIESPLFPELVELIRIESLGAGYWQLDARGCNTRTAYQQIVSDEDLQQMRVTTPTPRDFRGDPEAFFLGIAAHHLHYAYLFDPLLAVNVSQIDPLPHQIEAVYHYILRQPDVRFLLADDPGAGKTIMAGLLIKELKYRGVAHRILLVVPGHLKFQWQREMKEKFGENFVIVDRSVQDAHWGRNVWLEQTQVITSMDFAKQESVLASLREAYWDLVIVDEAHKMAAYQYGNKTSKTARYQLGELLSQRTAGLLFLTATPHRGDPENFRLLLDLLRPGFFGTVELLEQSVQQRDNPLFLRRLKEDLKDFNGRPLFPPRHVKTRTFYLSEPEKRLYNALTEYVAKEYNRALQGDNRNTAFALILLQRRFASSIYAARKSLERRKQRLEKLLDMGVRFTEEGQALLFSDWDELDEMEEQERLQIEEAMLEKLTNARTLDELRAEIATLDHLVRLAREAERQDIETKFRELTEVLTELQLRETGEKLVVFTESRDTLDYLVSKLRRMGFSVTALHGGMGMDERIRAEHEFRHQTQVMVSTEAGGEGINLQFCSLMINYDIPWNPNRLEQRMGRIHRYGQQKEVYIYNLVAYDTREGEVLATLLEKLEKIKEQLGSDRVFDVINDVLDVNLRDLIIEAITNRRNWQEIVREIRATPDAELIQRVREATQEALATRHIDMQAILSETRRARENRPVPEYVEEFFKKAANYLKIDARMVEPHVWRVRSLPYEIRRMPESFKRQFGEVYSDYERIAFDKQIARACNAEFVSMGHPLLEAIGLRLREGQQSTLARGALFGDPSEEFNGWLYFYIAELRDGLDQVAARQIATLYVDTQGAIRSVDSSLLWDLAPLPDTQPPTDTPPVSESDLQRFLLHNLLEPKRKELLQARQQLAQIKRKYGIASLNRRIGDLMDAELRTDLPEAERANIRRRKEEAEKRLEELKRQIEREEKITLVPPHLLAVARVIPHPNPQAHEMRSDPEIERIGMEVALAYERAQGRNPVDVSAEYLGYDIRSEAPDGSVRYIEVKARAYTGDLLLTPNEWIKAQRLGDEYWLYIVTHAATNPQLHLIQNPAARLRPKPVVEIVRYKVTESDWETKAVDARSL
ncbi:MAG: helicase-related protein [Armatimonadota bacterium]|nr:helicase-related protein [Armatimonadota bacterium]